MRVGVRWVVGAIVRFVYRRRIVTVTGEAGVPFRFRPAEYPILLRGPAQGDRAMRAEWVRLLRPGEVIFDIGANIGTTVQRFHAILEGACRIWAFEPMPRNRELLDANAAALPGDTVTIVACALGDQDGSVTFCDNLAHGALSRRAATLTENNERWPRYWNRYAEVQVEMLTLDTFVRDHADAVPTFLKIDVEGAGGAVLAGARETLRDHKPIVSSEFHSDAERAAMVQHLTEAGYRCMAFDDARAARWGEPSATRGQFVHPDDPRVDALLRDP